VLRIPAAGQGDQLSLRELDGLGRSKRIQQIVEGNGDFHLLLLEQTQKRVGVFVALALEFAAQTAGFLL
jgi:hypothetical protein